MLQRKCACGNHAAGGECENCATKRLQKKGLAIGSAEDPLEAEADRVADEVTNSHVSAISPLQPLTLSRLSTSDSTGEVPPIVGEVLRTSGRALDDTTRAYFEPRFGHDFSGVRIHADAHAAASARAVQAAAYTVGHDIVFGHGQFNSGSEAGRRLLAHELTHVVQQSQAGGAASPGTVQRKVILNGTEMPAKDRRAFLKARKWTNASLAQSVMEDMAAADDKFDFANEDELQTEITKRLSTVKHMKESQQAVKGKGSAFGYPFSGDSALYGPRVNYEARDYWEPGVPDNYAVRTDKAKNKLLKSKPRHERCTVYGDQCNDYGWKLSKKGQADPYSAIAKLFTPQPPHKRTLLHCDYLISLVNLMSLADSIGPAEFNKRIAAFGADRFFLKWNAFSDLHLVTLERDPASGLWATDPAGKVKPKWGLRSTQRVTPSSEADLVIGDHVVFFNHLAYDLINQRIGNAWRLENAVLVSKDKGTDWFLGHGSGYKTAGMMRAKLAQEFNEVARKAVVLTKQAESKHKHTQAAASKKLADTFPNVKQVGKEWRVQGVPGLIKNCAHNVDEKLREIKSDEVLGPKSPCDPTKMNEVERPIESAK